MTETQEKDSKEKKSVDAQDQQRAYECVLNGLEFLCLIGCFFNYEEWVQNTNR